MCVATISFAALHTCIMYEVHVQHMYNVHVGGNHSGCAASVPKDPLLILAITALTADGAANVPKVVATSEQNGGVLRHDPAISVNSVTSNGQGDPAGMPHTCTCT
jgi:hypothetical protein